MSTIDRKDLETYLNQYLEIDRYFDYGPNGLQVQGKDKLKKIAFAVSATKASIEECIKQEADTLIVHHGLFWSFHGPKTLVGPFYHRVAPLVQNHINLFGYHLPLDAHLEIGNAKAIADLIDLDHIQAFGDHKGAPLGVKGVFKQALCAQELHKKLESILSHSVIYAPGMNKKVESMGIITGGANSKWTMALEDQLDSYLTGEISEHDWHDAQEAGIHMYAGGHNATESFGIQKLMEHIQQKFQIDCFYIPSPNPA